MAGYALVDQFCRAGELQGHFFRRCQREFRDEVLPALKFLEDHGDVAGIEAALTERDALKQQLADAQTQIRRLTPKAGKKTEASSAA